jgi:hypothetical protein
MAIITKKEFLKLSEIHHSFCISIYIPTHRSGFDEKKQDAIYLKNQVGEIKNKLVEKGMGDRAADTLLAPITDLVKDEDFWQRQSDGLALFLTPDQFNYYEVPVNFEAENHLAGHFYLKPLLPIFTGDGMFFILALQADDTALYQATKYSIAAIKIDDLIPDELEETVGYDYEQKTFQFRTQQSGSTVFHGHGAGKDDVQPELEEYFRDIDKGLMRILNDETLPMLLVGDPKMLSIYKDVNTYNHLLEKTLNINPSSMDEVELHEKSWELLKPDFEKEYREKKEQYGQYFSEGKAIDDTEAVLQAAFAGKIETLFVHADKDQYGIYNPADTSLQVTGSSNPSAVSVTNLAAVTTMQKGGTVYLTDEDEMPQKAGILNALLRY